MLADLDYTGQFQDTASGLYDFLYRKYSPAQGRWVRPDPAGLRAVDPRKPQSWNRYAYVNNNPLALVDPFGLFLYGGPPCNTESDPSCDGGSSANFDTGAGLNPGGPGGCPIDPFLGVPDCSGGGGGQQQTTGAAKNAPNCTPGTKGCSNVPTAEQQCLNQFYSTALGKGVQLLSPLQMIPGWGQDPQTSVLETALSITTKATVITAAANAGQPAVQTLSSDAWSLVGPIEQFMGSAGTKALSFAKVAGPVAWGGGAVLDVMAHAACNVDPNSSGEGIPVAPK